MVNVTKNIENFERVVIDSLKIRIPFHRVEILSDELQISWSRHNAETFVVKENEEPTFQTMQVFPVKNDYGDILYKIRYDVLKATIKKNAPEKFLFIGINSKILEQKYFEGITSDNIRLIYDKIIKHNIASFTFEDFLNGECTDVDFKKDVRCHEFQKVKSILSKMTKKTGLYGNGAKTFNQKDNSGIQWSKRETSTPSNPYFKLYNKKVELETKSVLYFEKYIKDQDYNLSGLIRIEYTIKNKKHFRENEVEGTRLTSLLQLSEEVKNAMLKKIVKHHLLPRVIEPVKPDTYLKPTEMTFYNLLLFGFENTYVGKEVLIDTAIKNVGPKSRKSEMRKRLLNIWDTYIQTLDRTKENEEQRTLFTALCWE